MLMKTVSVVCPFCEHDMHMKMQIADKNMNRIIRYRDSMNEAGIESVDYLPFSQAMLFRTMATSVTVAITI